jgi:hypothetical protein
MSFMALSHQVCGGEGLLRTAAKLDDSKIYEYVLCFVDQIASSKGWIQRDSWITCGQFTR